MRASHFLAAVLMNLLSISLAAQVKLGPWIPEVSETSFTVNWETHDPQFVKVEIIEDGHASTADTLKFFQTKYGRSIVGNSHSVKVTGLEPGTVYSYRICGTRAIDESQPYRLVYGKEEKSGDWHRVRTLDFKAPSCRFSMVNDIHGDKELFRDLLCGVSAQDMDFMLMNGDMVSYMTSIETVKDRIISPAGELLHNVPMMYARGNHEGRGQDFWRFDEVAPLRDGKAYYAFRQGPVAFIVIDCGEDKPDTHPAYCGNAHFDQYRAEEAEWLQRVVKEKWFRTAPYKVCVSHIPMSLEEDSWYTQQQLHEAMLPILNKAGIDLMLSAHFHRHVFVPGNTCGNAFPILINDCDERLDFVCEGKTARIKIYSREGSLVYNYDL